MDCQQARRWLSLYLDSELEPSRLLDLTEHLRTCASCRERFEAERRVDDLVSERLQEGRIPAGTWRAIERAVRRSAWRRRWWVRAGAGLAAALALTLAGPWAWTTLAPPRGPAAWAVQRFLAEAHTFIREEPGLPAAAMRAATGDILGVPVSLAPIPETAPNHRIEPRAVRRLSDKQQVAALEIRLTCCGRPVLLFLAPADAPGRWAGVRDAASAGGLRDRMRGVYVAARQKNHLLAVAVSRHPVEQVLDALRIGG